MAVATQIAFHEFRHKRAGRLLPLSERRRARSDRVEPSTDAPRDRQLLRERVLAEFHIVLDPNIPTNNA